MRGKKKENSGERAAFLYVEDKISDSELGSEQAGEGDSEWGSEGAGEGGPALRNGKSIPGSRKSEYNRLRWK